MSPELLEFAIEKGPLWVFFIGSLFMVHKFFWVGIPRIGQWFEGVLDRFIDKSDRRDRELSEERAAERERTHQLMDRQRQEHILDWERARIENHEREARMERRLETLFAQTKDAMVENSKQLKKLYLMGIAHYKVQTGRSQEILFQEMSNISGEIISPDGEIIEK